MLRSYRKQAEEVSAARLSLATLTDERDSLRAQVRAAFELESPPNPLTTLL